MRKCIILLTLIIGFSFSFADTLCVPISQITTISNNNTYRFLLRVDISSLINIGVDYAELVIPHFLTSGKMVIEGYQITTDWNQSTVNWNSFTNQGGDYDDNTRTRYITSASVNLPVILDITDYVKDWINNGNNYGIILKRPKYEGNGFRTNVLQLNNALTNARVRIIFARLED